MFSLIALPCSWCRFTAIESLNKTNIFVFTQKCVVLSLCLSFSVCLSLCMYVCKYVCVHMHVYRCGCRSVLCRVQKTALSISSSFHLVWDRVCFCMCAGPNGAQTSWDFSIPTFSSFLRNTGVRLSATVPQLFWVLGIQIQILMLFIANTLLTEASSHVWIFGIQS